MKKKIILSLFIPLLSLSMMGCSNQTSSSSYEPKTELEAAFYNLKDNNFTVDMHEYLVNFDRIDRNQKFYYTSYSVQAEGSFGFSGYAQSQGYIFKYTINDGDVVTSAPLINYSTGLRYESIYDYTYGMQNFDVTSLPSTKDENGYYTYEFHKNRNNDYIIMGLFLRQHLNDVFYPEIKIKTVKNYITFEVKGLEYIDGSYDSWTINVYDVNKTENTIIKEYLETGKTGKSPLDLRFYSLINPYLYTKNYTATYDASGMLDPSYNTFKMTDYCTENAIYSIRDGQTTGSGKILNQGSVSTYTVYNDKLQITSTPMNEDQEFYSDLYYYSFNYSFQDLDYSLFIGYKDDQNDNIYYLTDSQCVYILSSLSYCQIYDGMYADQVKIEIVNEETHEFNLYFEFYNKTTKRELGTYKVSFTNLGNTKLDHVDRYFAKGDNPSSQTESDFNSVMNKFKQGNYSRDVNVYGAGITKYIYTEKYMIAQVYGSPNSNYGYIKQDNHIYEFSILNNEMKVDTTIDYSASIKLPGCGSFMHAGDDLQYLSHFDDGLYTFGNYDKLSVAGEDCYKVINASLSSKLFNYFFGTPEAILNTGVGIKFSNSDDPYDTRVTFIASFVASDGSYQASVSYTYYDIGNSSHPVVEAYLNGGN